MAAVDGKRRKSFEEHPALRRRPRRGVPRVLVAVLGLAVLIGIAVLAVTLTTPSAPGAEARTSSRTPWPSYDAEQLHNAAAIVDAGDALDVPDRGIEIAVMTAMGESALIDLHHGDAAGPDSIGVFQQRDSWGSRRDRLDPGTSARLFYRQLLSTAGWAQMAPTRAAHAVQINADPDYYAQYWDRSVALVKSLRGQHPRPTGPPPPASRLR